MLTITDLHVYYDAIHAIKGVNLSVKAGSIVSLIGANGAGKTSILHAVSRLISIKSGQINYDGHFLEKIAPHKIVNLGLAQVPEGRRVFSRLSVRENLELGAFTKANKAEISEDMEKVLTLFPRLKERQKQTAGTLSGGEQQMLAIGRAIMSRPKLLLLDEPSMGLSPILVQEIFAIIKECNRQGMTILLVEQNANMALSIANWAYVLETGRIVLQGVASKLLKNADIRRAYLGG